MRTFVLIGAAACGILSLRGAGFDAALVPSDAKWLAYVDLETFRKTTIGGQLSGQVSEVLNGLSPADPNTGIRIDFLKLFETVESATAFGTNFTPDPQDMDGALIVRGTADLRKIIEGVAVQASIMSPKDVAEVTGQPFDTYLLGKEVYLGFPPEQVILLSRSKEQLVRARDLVRGAGKSLAQTPSAPLAKLAESNSRAYAIAATVAPPQDLFKGEVDSPPARIFSMIDSGAVTIGELGGAAVSTSNLHIALVAPTDDAAGKLNKVVQGLAAMVSLNTVGRGQTTKFLDAAIVSQEGRTVAVDLSYPSSDVVRIIQSIMGVQQASPNAAQATGAPSPSNPPFAEWVLDGAPTLTHRLVENVPLKTNSNVVIYTRRQERSQPFGAFIDRVEITPVGQQSGPLRFEAERMNLSGYRAVHFVEDGSFQPQVNRAPPVGPAAGKKYVTGAALRGEFGSVQFPFPGTDGTYNVDVFYRDESGATSKMSIRVEDPR